MQRFLGGRAMGVVVSLAVVAGITLFYRHVVSVNHTTVALSFLLAILAVSAVWGMLVSAFISIVAMLTFNFFFLPPVGTFTIADPQNWVALFSFLATSLIASRLSAKAKARALEAVERQQDVERLYSFSRAILLIDRTAPFPQQVIERLAEIFKLNGAVLYELRTGEFYRTGTAMLEGVENQLREAPLSGSSFSEIQQHPILVGVRLGSEP